MPITTHGTEECSVAFSRKIAGQQLPTLLDVIRASVCTPCCKLLQVVASCCVLLGSCCAVWNRPNLTTPNIVELLRPLARSFTLLHLQQYTCLVLTTWFYYDLMKCKNLGFSFFLSAYKLNVWLAYKGNKNHRQNIAQYRPTYINFGHVGYKYPSSWVTCRTQCWKWIPGFAFWRSKSQKK